MEKNRNTRRKTRTCASTVRYLNEYVANIMTENTVRHTRIKIPGHMGKNLEECGCMR